MKNKLNYYFVGLLLLYGVMPAMGSPPDWATQPSNFANTSNIIAKLQTNDNLNEELNNIIGFFVGGEVRAVAEPIMMGGDVIYFITTYSNELSGENMTMRVYIAADDAIYTSPDVYSFNKSELLGSLEEPHLIRFYTDGDFPIAIDDIPQQITLQEMAFATIDLNDFLIQEDNDFINWGYQINNNLEVELSGSLLTFIGSDPEWIGSTFLDITATEVTSNQYFATQRILFTIKEAFTPPQWDGPPSYTVNLGALFPSYNLNDYEHVYDGNCLEFSVQPIIEIPDPWFTRPDWSVTPQDYQYTMTTIHKVQFSEYYTFNNSGDLLGAFINGEVRGVASPVVLRDEVYFFITTYSNTQEEVNFKFFSQEFRDIYDILEPTMFVVNFSNEVTEPIILDVAPIKVQIQEFDGVIIYVCDDTWVGSQEFEYTVQDCNDPILQDVVTVTYTVNDGSLATDLLHFEGHLNEKQAVDLNWKISPNPALSHFEIQRSGTQNGASNWTVLTKVENPEVSTEHFSYTDTAPLKSINYYRLKMVEKSGEHSYSNIISIEPKWDNASFSFYPNPVLGQKIQLVWPSSSETTAKVQIFDVDAQLVFQQEGIAAHQALQLPKLVTGLYLLQVQTNDGVWAEKMLVP